jgi:CBS domain-containing protein
MQEEPDSLSEEFSIMYEEPLRAKMLGAETFRTPVRNLRKSAPVLMHEMNSVQEAVAAMRANDSHCVLIMRNAKLAGILTEHDIIGRALPGGKDLAALRVQEIMTPDPESLREDDSLAFLMNAMHAGGYRHVPIVDDAGVPLGVVSVADVLEYIVENFPEDVLNVAPRAPRNVARQDGG